MLSEPWKQFVPDGIQHEPSVDGVRRLVALGGLVRASSLLEMNLRRLYCALIDSKYAAITAAGQSVSWLVENCRVTARRRLDLTDSQRAEVVQLLNRAGDVMEKRRNRFVHDVWASGDESVLLLRSKRGNYKLDQLRITTDEIAAAAQEIGKCHADIISWMSRALPESHLIEAQLRIEDHSDDADER